MPQKKSDLYQIQCQMAQAIMRPLENGFMQKKWVNSTNAHDVVSQFIKPNDLLNSFERLQIYNQQYWYRLLDSMQEDFPGLRSILGEDHFEKLCVSYIAQHPSRSYSLNELGNSLADFILENPLLSEPYSRLAYEMACVEWAEIVAYDAILKPLLTLDELQGRDPCTINLQLQPCITILQLSYLLDDFLSQLDKPVDKSVESNAFVRRIKKADRELLPVKRRTHLVVHRLDNTVYFKRLNNDQYLLLRSLANGKNVIEACEDLIKQKNHPFESLGLIKKVNKYFAEWMELGWFCRES